MIDCFDFVTTSKHTLGRVNRIITDEIRIELGDRAWDEFEEPSEGELGDCLVVIDEAEFEIRYMSDDNPPDELTRADERLIAMLKRAGYIVEDMGSVYGPEFAGEYRWINCLYGQLIDFQDDDTSDSKADAWFEAFQHYCAAHPGR